MSRLADIPIPVELISQARAGDEAAQAGIYRALAPALFSLVRRLVGNKVVAEDLFQDTMLAMFQRLGFIPDQQDALEDALASMKKLQEKTRPDIQAVNNPAKRYAGQLMGRWVTIMGSGLLTTVARRWKGQMNEIAKAGANFEFLPEADHNTLAGTMNPEEVLNPHTMTLFLRAPSDHPRNRLRSDLTRKAFMLEGMNTDHVDAQGNTALAHMWTLILFGDYVAYYLSMGYGVDPTPIQALVDFKKSMSEAK